MKAVVRETDLSYPQALAIRGQEAPAAAPGSPSAHLTSGLHVATAAVIDVDADTTWHAVWTRSRHEHQVCMELSAKGVEAFLPTITHESRWSDRTKRIAWPLFPGYCFARFEPELLSRVVRCSGVVAVLSNAGQPTPVPGNEINALQRLVASGLSFDPCALLAPGSKVRVINGPLSGVVGRLVRKGTQDLLILAVELLNGGARVQVSSWDVEPVDAPPSRSSRRMTAGSSRQ